MRNWQRRSLTALGILMIAPIPMVLVVALRRGLTWYEGAALFYGTLATAEIAYLGVLLAARRRHARDPVAVLS